jgi:hypothetical protein
MSRALVVVTHGDREWSEPMAGAIVEGMSRRVIPLDGEELAAVKAELAEIKAAKARQDARDGVRDAGDEKRWAAIRADMAQTYRVRTPGPVRRALLVAWAMLWAAIYEGTEALMRWNREG